MSYVDKVTAANKKERPKEAINALTMEKQMSNPKKLQVPGMHESDEEVKQVEDADDMDDTSDEEFDDTEDEKDADEEQVSELTAKKEERDKRREEKALKDDILTLSPTEFADAMKKQFGDKEFLDGYKIINDNSGLLFESGGEDKLSKMIGDKVAAFKSDAKKMELFLELATTYYIEQNMKF